MKRKDSSGQPGNDVQYNEALKRAAALCSRQEQCARHIREKLVQWNVEEHNAEKIIQRLTEEKFLDDHRYAEYFVKDKFRLNRWGKVKITHMLRHKGIGEDSIQDALHQIDKDEYYRICADLIRNKSASLKEKNLFTRKGKLYRFASGRGFESDLIHRILNKSGGE